MTAKENEKNFFMSDENCKITVTCARRKKISKRVCIACLNVIKLKKQKADDDFKKMAKLLHFDFLVDVRNFVSHNLKHDNHN